jgi:nicotinamide mononucleotide transporter
MRCRFVKNICLPVLFATVSIVFSVLTDDAILGSVMLIVALLSTYYSMVGKIINFPICIIYYGLWVYVGYIDGFYLTAATALFVGIPMQIVGWINWSKNKDNGDVEIVTKSFPIHYAVAVTAVAVVASALIGFGLSFIPGANATFLDSLSNVFDIFGVLLLTFRFRESWYIFIMNNLIDIGLAVFAVTAALGHAYALLAQAVGIMLMNIASIILWIKDERTQNRRTPPKLVSHNVNHVSSR